MTALSHPQVFQHFAIKFAARCPNNELRIIPDPARIRNIWDQMAGLRVVSRESYLSSMRQTISRLSPYPNGLNDLVDVILTIDQELWHLYNLEPLEPKRPQILDLMFEPAIIAIRVVNDLLTNGGERAISDAITITYSLASPVAIYQCESFLRRHRINLPGDMIKAHMQEGKLDQALSEIQALKKPFSYGRDLLYEPLFYAYLDRNDFVKAASILKMISSIPTLLTTYSKWVEKSNIGTSGSHVSGELFKEMIEYVLVKGRQSKYN